MTRQVLLNNVDHHDLRVEIRHGAAFGDTVNQLAIFPTEFEQIQREFPILFRRQPGGAFQAVALLGLDRDENLFLGEAGWTSRYVPAIQRRGPFSIALQEREEHGEVRREPMIHVDLDDPRIGREHGHPLFLPHGGNAAALEHVSEALRIIYQGLERAGAMFALFEALSLIEPVALEIQLRQEKQYTLPDCHTVSAERFGALDAQALDRLHQEGFLAPALFAMSSLGNIYRLIELKNAKAAAPQPERINV